MSFELITKIPHHYGEPLFDLTVDGFTEGWWSQIYDPQIPTEHVSLREEDQEIARASINLGIVLDYYVGVEKPSHFNEIVFFEVRKDKRRKGIGRYFVSLLVQKYPELSLCAFSEDADYFWREIGWTYCPQIDGDTTNRPLFVSFQNDESR